VSYDFDLVVAQRRIFESALEPLERLVALAILDHWSRKSDKPYPSITRLQAWTGLCKNAVLHAIRGLKRAGAIQVTSGGNGTSNAYDIGPLMRLPVRETNRSTWSTGSPDERVHQTNATSSPGAPRPVRPTNPKEPTEGTNEGTKSGARKRLPLARKAPLGFEFNEADREAERMARFRGVDLDATRAAWLGYEYGRGIKDFHAAWRNWLSRERPRNGRALAAVQETPDGATFDDEAERRAEELVQQGNARGQLVQLTLAGGSQ
jgi:hypothetical protein